MLGSSQARMFKLSTSSSVSQPPSPFGRWRGSGGSQKYYCCCALLRAVRFIHVCQRCGADTALRKDTGSSLPRSLKEGLTDSRHKTLRCSFLLGCNDPIGVFASLICRNNYRKESYHRTLPPVLGISRARMLFIVTSKSLAC